MTEMPWVKLLTSLSQDTSPALGGSLDATGHSITATGALSFSAALYNFGAGLFWDGATNFVSVAQMASAYANRVTDNVRYHNLAVAFDGGGEAIATGATVFALQPYAPDANANWKWSIVADVAGSITVKVFQCGNYSSGTYNPASTSEVSPTGGISIVSDTYASGDISTTGGWTAQNMVNGMVFRFEVTACTSITKATVTLLQTKAV